jgi:hypothetical protein
MENKSTSRYGVDLAESLLIIFIVLKLTDNIDWSWWWVMAPLWIPLTFLIILLIIIGLIKAL